MPKVRRIDFSASEWLEGTQELSDQDRGVYITICALIWARGGRINFELLQRHSQSHGNALKASLSRLAAAHKIQRNGSEIGQKRAENELKTAGKRSRNAADLASKRWNNKELETSHALQPRTANHQPSTINHQPPLSARSRARGASQHRNEDPHRALSQNGHDLTKRRAEYDDLPAAGGTNVDEATWRHRIASFANPKPGRKPFWHPNWGFPPDDPSCYAPAQILAEFGYHHKQA